MPRFARSIIQLVAPLSGTSPFPGSKLASSHRLQVIGNNHQVSDFSTKSDVQWNIYFTEMRKTTGAWKWQIHAKRQS
jgi:hypothetical protein